MCMREREGGGGGEGYSVCVSGLFIGEQNYMQF